MKAPNVKISDYITSDEYEKLLGAESIIEDLELDHINKVFVELEKSDLRILKSASFLDVAKVLIRGAVTRIGAYSNIGKSKLAYWISIQLLKNNYSGIIFSTEVNRHTVLSNLISCVDEVDFWKVAKKEHIPSEKCRDLFSSLQIYDGRRGAMFLKTIREFVIANGGNIDFIIVDFCQNIKDYQFSKNEYEQMSNYALEIQQLAQNFDICVIDLSQLANSAVKEDYKKSGFISFKGSGALYASADIGIQLVRDKENNPNQMFIEVRKHKYYKTGDILVEVDFSTTNFQHIDSLTEKALNKFQNDNN